MIAHRVFVVKNFFQVFAIFLFLRFWLFGLPLTLIIIAIISQIARVNNAQNTWICKGRVLCKLLGVSAKLAIANCKKPTILFLTTPPGVLRDKKNFS